MVIGLAGLTRLSVRRRISIIPHIPHISGISVIIVAISPVTIVAVVITTTLSTTHLFPTYKGQPQSPQMPALLNDFTGPLRFLFYSLNLFSMLLSILVYKIFQEMKQNKLIRSSSVICVVISLVLLMGWPMEEYHRRNSIYCSLQALILNYCFISTHAHLCFVMWNNLATATGSKFLGIKPSALVGLMFFISIAIPFVPTIIILAYSLSQDSVFTKFFFFCVVDTKVAWSGYRLWFILFSFPGIIAASILFWKTIHSREQMLKYSNTSQFSKTQLIRMFFAIITYLVASILSVILGLLNAQMNPDDSKIKFSDFMPPSVGFLLFLTYGLGTTALEYYKKVYVNLGEFFGVEIKDSRSSISSRRDSLVSTVRRKSSINSGDTRTRKTSLLSESVDENFIYDLTDVNEVTPLSPSAQPTQTQPPRRVRRGSEPVNRRTPILRNSKKNSIDMIPEEDENEDDTQGNGEVSEVKGADIS